MANPKTTAWAIMRSDDYEYGASAEGIVAGPPDAVVKHLLHKAETYSAGLDPAQWPKREVSIQSDPDYPDTREVYLDLGCVNGIRWTAARFEVEELPDA